MNKFTKPCRLGFRSEFIILSIGLVTACRRESSQLVVSGRLEVDDIHVGSKVGGRIEQILAREGDTVDSGTVLLKLDGRELQAQLNQAEAERQRAQAQLDLLLAGTRREEIEQAEAALRACRADLEMKERGFRTEEIKQAAAIASQTRSAMELARRELERFEKLRAEGVVSQSEADNRRSTYEQARAQYNEASERERLYRRGSRPEEIAIARQAAAREIESTAGRARS